MNMMNQMQTLLVTRFDSGALGGLAAVVHRLSEAGPHTLTILQGDKAVQTALLTVRGVDTLGAAVLRGAPVPGELAELHIDLSGNASGLGQALGELGELVLGSGGYAVFHAVGGTSSFAVQVQAAGNANASVFDSRQLGNGDIFTTTLFRPGRYSVTNMLNKAQMQLRVSYPVIGDTPYTPPEAQDVQLDQNGFEPQAIQLLPAQGIAFHIGNTQARIEIDLIEPDDGPQAVA